MTEIEGKVAKIIDVYTIIINKGSEHGVEEDMRFVIYEPGEDVKDPDTKKSLGNFEYVKAKVKVTYVREKFATAETYETYTFSLSNIAAILTEKSKRRELPLEEETREQLQEKRVSSVKIGDLVRHILD
ncbi:MAG: hypothetical protein KAW92_01205 [Candidatus Cloacimonetes bacterium]|nr:hypothetical protein [Candidatus Cloacimonadota bacterium]